MANVIRDTLGAGLWFEVLPSAARTATPDTQEFVIDRRGFNPSGLVLVLDATAITSTPSITVTVSGVDRVSGKIYTILTSTAIATVSTTVLKIGAGLTAAANLVANDLVPPVLRITVTHGNANSITYSVGAMLA